MPKRSLWGYSPKAVRNYLNELNEQHAARRSVLLYRKRLLEEEQRDLQHRFSEETAADGDTNRGKTRLAVGKGGGRITMSDEIKLKRRIGGWHPRYVKGLIRKLKHLHGNELQDLAEDIARLEAENERLSGRLRSREPEALLELLPEERTDGEITPPSMESMAEDILKQAHEESSAALEALASETEASPTPTVPESAEPEADTKLELPQDNETQADDIRPLEPEAERPEAGGNVIRFVPRSQSEGTEKGLPGDVAVGQSFFWGGIETFFEQPAVLYPQTERTEPQAVPLPIVEAPSAAEVKAPAAPPVKPAAVSKESPVIDQEIMAIRYRYIVGKAAGEELYARDGRLIVGRLQTITEEIVEWADREGKLPDLIMSMIIPGLEDEA